jgi:hypothetical protein
MFRDEETKEVGEKQKQGTKEEMYTGGTGKN